MMMIHLKLYGVFRSAAGVESLDLDVHGEDATVRSAIAELVSRPALSELKKLILDEVFDPRSNALILLGGREIGTLGGLDTRLKSDDELSLLPIAHGG